MAIVIQNVTKRFGDKLVLDRFSASLPDRGVVAVSGASGSGKTTLLNILMGLTAPDGGEIMGIDRLRFTAVFQEDRLFERMSVRRNISLVCPGTVRDSDIDAHLRAVGLGDEADAPVRGLSGGMKRRVALVRAVIAPGDVLAMDEPFRGLDAAAREKAAAYTLKNAGGRLIILVTHDMEEAAMMGAAMTLKIR